MELVVNPPTPWPDWQAPVSTRKARPTISAQGYGLRGWRIAPAAVSLRVPLRNRVCECVSGALSAVEVVDAEG